MRGGTGGGIAEVPEERKERIGRARGIVAVVVGPEDGRACVARNVVVMVIDELEVELAGLVAPVDEWRDEQTDKPSRPAAIVRLAAIGLKAK